MVTFGRAYFAADQRGLTLEERAQFMHEAMFRCGM